MLGNGSFKSFYYRKADKPYLPAFDSKTTAFLVIDVQNAYLPDAAPDSADIAATEEYEAWKPFYARMREKVIPNIARLQKAFREKSMEVLFARIAARTKDGRERSLSQKMPGWNSALLPMNEKCSQIVDAIAPVGDEITVIKTTDSALTGTNLRLLLNNLGIKTVVCAGVFTDQCVASTVRSLSDESFYVLVAEDGCAAATEELHEAELTIINFIYANVMSTDDILVWMKG
ncbi:MAG TPA: amidase [Sutterella sp.]|nr:amidase [Sutterella sp.]